VEETVEFVELFGFLLYGYVGFLGWFRFDESIAMNVVCAIRVYVVFVTDIPI